MAGFVRRQRAQVGAYAVLSILFGVACPLSTTLAADSHWGWDVFIGTMLCFLGCLWLGGRASKLELLYDRAIRSREVEIFEAAPITDAVRLTYSKGTFETNETDEGVIEGDLWEGEEAVVKKLTKIAGAPVDRIECVGTDAAVLVVGGRIVNRVINLPVAVVKDPPG